MTETVMAAWINSVFAGFDEGITIAVHNLYEIGGGFFTPFFEFMSLLGKGGIFMGMARIYLCVHYPSDVFGGLIVGTCAGIAAVVITKKLPEKLYQMEFGIRRQK